MGDHMSVIRTERFVVPSTEVRAVSRTDSSYHEKAKDGKSGGKMIYVYSLEVYMYERGSIYVDYDNKNARDADFEAIAAVFA
jgi:hypothetical protein